MTSDQQRAKQVFLSTAENYVHEHGGSVDVLLAMADISGVDKMQAFFDEVAAIESGPPLQVEVAQQLVRELREAVDAIAAIERLRFAKSE